MTTATATLPGLAAQPDAGRTPRRKRRRVRRQPALYSVAFDPTAKAEPARGRKREEEERHSALQAWRASVTSPYTWEVCDAFPLNDIRKKTGGRPRDYPDWLMFLILIAVPTFEGSVRNATTVLNDPAEWDRFTRHVHNYIPEGWTSPLTGLPKSNDPQQDQRDQQVGSVMRPPQRHHLAHFLFCWRGKPRGKKKPPAGIAKVRKRLMREFRDAALRQSFGEGRLTTTTRFDIDRPNPACAVNFDGTVIPFRRPKSTTPDQPGMDTDLGMWKTGTGDEVYGSKFVFASTRTRDYRSRIILDVEHVPARPQANAEHSGETKAIIDMLQNALPTAPGIRVITSDSALRGRGIQHVHALGPVVVNDPHVAQKADEEAGQPAIPKDHLAHTIRGHACTHHIYYQHGAPYERTLDADGNKTLVSLTIVKYERRANKDGTFRHYHVLAVPCPDGAHHERIPLFRNPEQGGLTFNRGEYMRVIPPGSNLHNAWYGLRNDTESLHSHLKDRKMRLPRNSVHQQSLMLIAYAVGQNALAYAFTQQRTGRPNALDNTA